VLHLSSVEDVKIENMELLFKDAGPSLFLYIGREPKRRKVSGLCLGRSSTGGLQDVAERIGQQDLDFPQ
jgi:hypothetical protein